MKQQGDPNFDYLEWEAPATVSLIESGVSIDISEGHLHERLRMFQHAWLVTSVWSESYEMIANGMSYLEGEVNAEPPAHAHCQRCTPEG